MKHVILEWLMVLVVLTIVACGLAVLKDISSVPYRSIIEGGLK